MRSGGKFTFSISWLLGLGLLFAPVERATAIKESDHFDGERFFNPSGKSGKSFWQFLKWQIYNNRTPWPEEVENKGRPQIASTVNDGEVVLTFINHATMLIQLKGLNILTDPIFSERCSPVSWAGPKRVRKPGIEFSSLPKIDVVLVSHNHYDHLDLPTLKDLFKRDRPKFFVPMGDGDLLRQSGLENVNEMDWWEQVPLDDRHQLIFTPARHWSGRGLFDRFESLWGGFVIRNAKGQVYYSGDAGYSYHFKEIRERLGKIDVSLLPIGAYEPRWFMKDNHMNPEEAVQAHLDLYSKVSIGVHFGTFRLTNEGIDEPPKHLAEAKLKLKVSDEQFAVMDFGETRKFILGPDQGESNLNK